MQPQSEVSRTPTPNESMDIIIRLGVVVLLVILCLRVVSPFANLMIWALVLSIALYPLHQRLANRLGGRQGSAATLIVVISLLLIGAPTMVLGTSFAKEVQYLYVAYVNGELVLEQPGPGVANWPVIGADVHNAWSAAADNLPAYIEQNRTALDDFAKRALSAAASTATSVLLFLVALIIAGIMMGFGQAGSGAMQRIFCKFAGSDKGPEMRKLSTMTVRSVAAGVVGVAFIQAILLGLGFLFAGIPAAGVLALITMLIGIVQLPALIISLPAIAYLWVSGDASTTSNVIWSIYLLVAGMADNVLKPLLLGRGVDAPMPVILLGALGGMVSAGIIGLFIGAALLALGYQIFMDWVGSGSEAAAPKPEARAGE
jgi:predicted PurR-regulated permease PerM